MLLGCIGDDFTGSSDIANTLAKGGMSVAQYNGIPNGVALSDVEAGIVSLKSRTAPVRDAVDESVRAAQWLLDQGCEQIFFKYCSTFDSTKDGNIGPVADALSKLLGEKTVVFCPAFPATGRSIYQGSLFVNDIPLHESGMKDHPLTPMVDSDLRRWLGHQTNTQIRHLPYSTISKGANAIREQLQQEGSGFYIADAIEDENLIELGKACSESKLLTGGSGLALELPANFRAKNNIGNAVTKWQGVDGPGIILSGSCSIVTRSQVARYCKGHPAMKVTAESILDGLHTVDGLCNWVQEQDTTPLIYTSADPAVVRATQGEFGQEFIAEKIETFFGAVAAKLVELGFKRIVSAGGETSGAIVTALNIKAMKIGPEIAPGVPALKDENRELALALKSGNFGGEDFFKKAIESLGR